MVAWVASEPWQIIVKCIAVLEILPLLIHGLRLINIKLVYGSTPCLHKKLRPEMWLQHSTVMSWTLIIYQLARKHCNFSPNMEQIRGTIWNSLPYLKSSASPSLMRWPDSTWAKSTPQHQSALRKIASNESKGNPINQETKSSRIDTQRSRPPSSVSRPEAFRRQRNYTVHRQ